MKSTIVNLVISLSLSAALGPAALRAQDRLTAAIPFDFTVGGKSLPAGDYRIEMGSDKVLRIRTDSAGVLTQVMPGEKSKTPGKCVIRFNRYGDRYFLSEISVPDRGFRLYPSRAEKELMAALGSPKTSVMVAAMRKK